MLTHISDELDDDWARERGLERRSAARSRSPARARPTRCRPAVPRSLVCRLPVPRRDLFANFARMRREMDQMLGDAWGRTATSPPQPRVLAQRRRLLLRRAPPAGGRQGRSRRGRADAVGIEVSGRELAIIGERPVQETEGRVYQQVEIPPGPSGGSSSSASTSTPSGPRRPTRTACCGSSCRSRARATPAGCRSSGTRVMTEGKPGWRRSSSRATRRRPVLEVVESARGRGRDPRRASRCPRRCRCCRCARRSPSRRR